jgi:hypothetical protein
VDVVTVDAQGRGITDQGQGLLRAESVKQAKYRPALACRPGWAFTAFAWETLGGFGPEAWAFLQRLARLCISARRRMALSEEDQVHWVGTTRAFLAQRVAVAALRQQCAAIREECLAPPHQASALASSPDDPWGPVHPAPVLFADLCFVPEAGLDVPSL